MMSFFEHRFADQLTAMMVTLSLTFLGGGCQYSHDQSTWYAGNTTSLTAQGQWTGQVCVEFHDKVPQCGWQLQVNFSKPMIFADSPDTSLLFIGNPTDHYVFLNQSYNGEINSTTIPLSMCLPFSGASSSGSGLSFKARVNCMCLLDPVV